MNHKVFNNHSISGSLIVIVVAMLIGLALLGAAHATETNPQDKSLSETENRNYYTERLQQVDYNLHQIDPIIRVIQEKLPSFLERLKSLDKPDLANALDNLEKEYDALKKKLEQLENQIDELKRAIESKQKEVPQQSIEQLEKKLAEDEREKKDLEEKLNRLNSEAMATSDRSKGCEIHEKFRNKRQVYVMIYKGRVAPMDEPYYSSTYGYIIKNGIKVPAAEKKRIQEGEPISQAIKTGGCLDKLLSNLNPDKEYVNFQVCKDSIGAFYLAVEEARRRKIPYSWEPEEDRTFIFSKTSTNSDGNRPGDRGVIPK